MTLPAPQRRGQAEEQSACGPQGNQVIVGPQPFAFQHQDQSEEERDQHVEQKMPGRGEAEDQLELLVGSGHLSGPPLRICLALTVAEARRRRWRGAAK